MNDAKIQKATLSVALRLFQMLSHLCNSVAGSLFYTFNQMFFLRYTLLPAYPLS